MAMAKTIVIAAVTLLLGVFIGGIGPRAELDQVKLALKESEARAQQGVASALPLALGLGSLAAARAQANQPSVPGGNARDRVPRLIPSDPNDVAPADGTQPPDRDDDNLFGGRDGGANSSNPFAATKAAADVRAAQFRAAFVEQAKLPPATTAMMDTTIKGMNEDLGRAADEIAKDLAARREKSEKVLPRDLADIGARVLDIYRKADDQFKAGLDENGRAAARNTDFDLLTQIDLGAFERLGQTLETLDRPPLVTP